MLESQKVRGRYNIILIFNNINITNLPEAKVRRDGKRGKVGTGITWVPSQVPQIILTYQSFFGDYYYYCYF